MDNLNSSYEMEFDNFQEESELDIVSGTIQTILYNNDSNAYTVLKLLSDSGNTITAVGYLPYAYPGEWLYAEGKWTNYKTYGAQFNIEQYDLVMPKTKENLFLYLSSGAIKYIGAATAALLVNKFGESVLDILENNPEQLSQIKGISPQRAVEISQSFHSQMILHRIVDYLSIRGLRPILAVRLYRYYGEKAMERIQENPYLLCSERIGGSFHEADSFASSIGIERNSIDRVKAAILFELKHNLNNGHCFISKNKLCEACSMLLSLELDRCEQGLASLEDDGEIIVEPIGNVTGCYLSDIYEAETYTAERIYEMSNNRLSIRMDPTKIIEQVEREQGITYSEDQKVILGIALNHQIAVLTGGPGTGKTTSICAILAAFETIGLDTKLCAPTGRAAKRMTELTGREAYTLHRLLGAQMSEAEEKTVFSFNEEEPLKCDAVIVDECSMVDITLMKALLCALPDTCRVVLVGDVDQLPSVGPGKVFADIINSKAVPTVYLNQIFRQKQDSRIVRFAHEINIGKIPNYTENKGDFFRLSRIDPQECANTVAELCSERLPNNMNIPSDRIQILSPTKKGETGTVSLNKLLQNTLNPADPTKMEKAFGDIIFREGDRVMQTRNNYDIMWSDSKGIQSGQGIYNGDIGVIRSIDPGNRIITVDFDDRYVKYEYDALDELEHAWALTVHKSQGSEFQAVILVLNSCAKSLMNRGILYTAITRAKQLLIIVGVDEIIHAMIQTDRVSKRYSGLRLRLKAYQEIGKE